MNKKYFKNKKTNDKIALTFDDVKAMRREECYRRGWTDTGDNLAYVDWKRLLWDNPADAWDEISEKEYFGE